LNHPNERYLKNLEGIETFSIVDNRGGTAATASTDIPFQGFLLLKGSRMDPFRLMNPIAIILECTGQLRIEVKACRIYIY